MKNPLYFIALLLPPEIIEQVTRWKEEMASDYDAKHALKSPPHITLQIPFRRHEDVEQDMIQKLNLFAEEHTVMDVVLSGIGSFPPRVIYVDVLNPDPIIRRFEALQLYLRNELNFLDKELTHKFHPHITLATRDLRIAVFPEAWSAFKDREYQSEFQSQSMVLLKHSGWNWEVFRTFKWGAELEDQNLF